MKSLLYPLIATALITVTPFLVSFEKGQDIVRGLFDYCVLFLLLLFCYVKDLKKKWKWPLLAVICAATMFTAFVDLKGLVLYKDGVIGWLGLIPFLTVAIALCMIYKVKGLSFYTICFVMFVSMGSHFIVNNFLPEQPLFEFPVVKAIGRAAPHSVPRNVLPEFFKLRYNATDSVKVTRQYIDTSRNNVVVLVESWGIPMDTVLFNQELALFGNNPTAYGVHFRMYSRTRTAEREDLLDSAWRDSTRRRDSLFIPNKLKDLGFQNTFLFGGDSSIQWRYRYIERMGFENTIYADSIVSDSLMALKIDSLLQDSSKKQLIAWTTRDTRFPIDDDAAVTEKLYFERLFNTLEIVAELAKKHPETRFIVQGDHEPILAPMAFMGKFYRRWVPFVVFN